jgi:hypothetical protein
MTAAVSESSCGLVAAQLRVCHSVATLFRVSAAQQQVAARRNDSSLGLCRKYVAYAVCKLPPSEINIFLRWIVQLDVLV